MGMKNSGIDWIGEIPDNWEINRIKYIANLYTGNSIPDDIKEYYEDNDNAYPYIATKDINVINSSIDYENGMYTKINDKSFKIAPKGTTLMCIEGGSAGRKIAKTNQIVSFVNKLCCFNAKNIDSNYLYMYLKSEAFRDEFKQHIVGLIGGVSQNKLKCFSIIIPPVQEQKLIADFLDVKIKKLHDILSDLNNQVEILVKYKKSLITEIVTKGINVNVSMKNSGIDWIGKIPEYWNVKPLKYSTLYNNKTLMENTKGDYEFRYIDIGSVSFMNGIENYQEMLFEDAPSRARRIVKKGDIIISTVRTYLKAITRIEDDDNVIVSTGFAVLSPLNYYDKYLQYYIESEVFCQEVDKKSFGIIYPAINISTLINIKTLIPPQDEQKQIADFLDKKCTQIDNLIADKQKQIEIMEKYKKSLIYEYVTGKKRVKGAEI